MEIRQSIKPKYLNSHLILTNDSVSDRPVVKSNLHGEVGAECVAVKLFDCVQQLEAKLHQVHYMLVVILKVIVV